MPSYWTALNERRVSRRRALTATAGFAGAAAFLAACGGGGEDEGPSLGTSGLLFRPADQTSRAKKGGTFNIAYNTSNATYRTGGGVIAGQAYSQLMHIKLGTYSEVPRGETTPEFAEAFELSPDGLKMTYRLRGLKFDERPPTNGRASTSEDVKFSWDDWEETSIRRQDLSHHVNSDAPVISVEGPDQQTIVFNLAFPFAPLHAWNSTGFGFYIQPVEAESEFNRLAEARGTGGFWVEDGDPSTGATLHRNENYFEVFGRPYFDTQRIHNIPEVSTIYAQFLAGALDMPVQHTNLILQQEQIFNAKSDNPNLIMYQRPFHNKGCGGLFFGRRPGSPFNDDRVRRALSMMLDRPLWGDTFSNRARFEAVGLPVDVKWVVGAGPGYHWWLDPEKNELGEASKNLHYNPEEARKLLDATGIPLPIQSKWQIGDGTSAAIDRNLTVHAMFEASGDFVFEPVTSRDRTEYFDNVRNVGGDFEGFSIAFYNDHMDFDLTMILKYHPSSSDYWMRLGGEDPKITDFVNRQRRELDQSKRDQIFQDFIKYEMEVLHYLPWEPTSFQPYYIAQPWLGNFGWIQPYINENPAGPGQLYSNFWFDDSKKT